MPNRTITTALLALLIIAAGAMPAMGFITCWSHNFGDEHGQAVDDLAVDSWGNLILAGGFYYNLDFGCGTMVSDRTSIDIYLAKMGPDGMCQWSQRFGDNASQGDASLAMDSQNNIIMSGYFLGSVDFGGGSLDGADSYLVKFDPMGNHLWSILCSDGPLRQVNAVTVLPVVCPAQGLVAAM